MQALASAIFINKLKYLVSIFRVAVSQACLNSLKIPTKHVKKTIWKTMSLSVIRTHAITAKFIKSNILGGSRFTAVKHKQATMNASGGLE